MRTGTFWLLMPLMMMVLSGCLQKAKTSISTLGSVSLQSPRLDSSALPDFENAQSKGYVRFRGSCVSVINSFQIQFVQPTGTSEWFDIPMAAPDELRSPARQTLHPLTAAEYDSSCEGDGRYDFWITTNQLTDWVGGTVENLPEVSQINLRGISPFLASSILHMPTHEDDPTDPEANTFQFYAGIYPVPIGVGYCQPFLVNLAYEMGEDLTYKVKNSVARTFNLTLESGLLFGSNFLLYETPDCSGVPLSNPATAISFPVGHEQLQYSYKVTAAVSPEKKITLAATFEGNLVTRDFKVLSQAALPTAYKVLVAPDSIGFADSGECREIDLIIVDANGVATKDYTSNLQISVANPDSSKFQLRSGCGDSGVALPTTIVFEFQKGVDYKKSFYVQSLEGVSSSTPGEILISEVTSPSPVLVGTSPILYINPSMNVHHLRLARGESLNFLFNHECYPLEVSLVDNTYNPTFSSHRIEFKLTTADSIQIFDDHNCQNANLTNTTLAFFPAESTKTYYWSRRQLSTGDAPLAISFSGSIEVDVLTTSLVAQPAHSEGKLFSITTNKSPLDWLYRRRGEILHWYHLPTVSLPDGEKENNNYLALPEINQAGSMLYVNGASVRQMYLPTFIEDGGVVRNIFRNLLDLAYYGTTLLWAYSGDSDVDLTASTGSAALIGAYLYFPNLSVSPRQQLFGNLSSQVDEFSVIVNSDGSLQVEHGSTTPTMHCLTPSGVVQEGKWQSIFVRFANDGAAKKCSIFVNGVKQADDTVPEWLYAWNPWVGSNLTGESLKASVLEVIIDKELNSFGLTKYDDSIINSLHTEYFEKRYWPSP